MEIDINILNKTRAEEFDADIWGRFYIPPYFKTLSLQNATKPVYIVGKRGCGKTMLLKYLDYHTAFSRNRNDISSNEISHIGIYWRVDTQFCNSLNYRGIEELEWISIFESYFSIVMVVEIIKALKTIALSSFRNFTIDDFNKISFDSAPDFIPEYPRSASELETYLESTRRRFSAWISNLKAIARPTLPPGKYFIDSIISDIKKYTGLQDAAFYIYLDEIENLVPYQKRVLNTFCKHSQKPLIINFTSKEQPNDTLTTGSESINATHDFKLITLDSISSEIETKRFFSEVFLANLEMSAGKNNSELVALIQNMDSLALRAESSYSKEIFRRMNEFYPSKTLKEFAYDAVKKERIFSKLKIEISKSLKRRKSELNSDTFINSIDKPELLLILPALLNRESNDPYDLLSKFIEFQKTSCDPQITDLIDNNLFGALLEAYRPYGLGCPIYSGFDTFYTLSNDNLRHFLILCYKAREMASLLDADLESIDPDIQARATYDAAEKLINEIRTFAPQGEKLRMFVLRIGTIFRALQANPAMSEPEQNQFSITSGRGYAEDEVFFLTEALKHGVLAVKLGNKSKRRIGVDVEDYQLNPIYAPYFQISYRRKRKIEISVDRFRAIALGSIDEYKQAFEAISKTNMDEILVQTELW